MIQYNVRPVYFSVQDTVKMLRMKGLSSNEAIKEVGHKLKGQLPEDILNRIKEGK